MLRDFGRLVFAAAFAGLAAGLLLTALQQVEIVPLLRQAEMFEQDPHHKSPVLLATIAANVVLATGFALLLAAAMSLRGMSGWRAGLLWGVAGYVVFFVAPSLGLPPELPGTLPAPLFDRQLWWVGAVASTAAGLWLAAFAQRPAWRVVGLALIALPHLIGAPRPVALGGTAPVELARQFVFATYLVNGLFWLTLGALLSFSLSPGRGSGRGS